MYKFKPAWAFKRVPRTDEIFSSWLLRTAKAHGAQLHTFCTQSLGKREIWTRDIDVSASKLLLAQCAQLSNESVESLEGMTLQEATHRLKVRNAHATFTPWILSLGVFHRLRKGHGIQFCPDCWHEDGEPYFRKKWRFAFMTDCDLHEGISLIDECPHCHSSLMPHRAPRLDFTKCAHCLKPINHSHSKIQNDYAAWMQQFLLALNQSDECSKNIVEASNWHSTCSRQTARDREYFVAGLRTLLKDIRNILKASIEPATSRKQIFEHLPVAERRHWMGRMGEACYAGPQGLFIWLKAHSVTQRQLSMKQYPQSLKALLSNLPTGNNIPKVREPNLLQKLSLLRLEHPRSSASYRIERANLLLPS